MAFDTWFGFDLIQRKTLEKKLAEAGAAELVALQAAVDDLTDRVEALEAETP